MPKPDARASTVAPSESVLVTAPTPADCVDEAATLLDPAERVVAAAPASDRRRLAGTQARAGEAELVVPDAVPATGAPPLRALGSELVPLLDERTPTVWLAVDALLDDGDLATAFRFVHVLTGHLGTTGGRIVCTLATESRPAETAQTLAPLFDRRVVAAERDRPATTR